MAIFSAAIFGGAGDIGELTASDLQTDFQLEE